MKAMICEMCGGRDLVKQDGLYVCQNCGCKYSAEEERKLFEINCKIEVDGISACEQLLEKGNTYLKLEDYKSAQDTFREFINTYPHKRIGYEKYFTALSENFSEYFVHDLADPNTKAELNKITERLKKIDDERDTYEAENFLKKIEGYLNWLDLKGQREQKEYLLNRISQENSLFSKEMDSARSMKKITVIVIAVFSVIGSFNLYAKSRLTVFIFLVAGFFLILLAFSIRDVKSISRMIDENCAGKTKLEKEISSLDDRINKIKINW